FGSKDDLIHLIKAAHDNEMQVYADIVINHNSGADDQELNPLNNAMRWTKFTPKSGKFNRDWTCFHPCRYETFDDGTFGDMPDLCHRNPYFFQQLLEYARWSVEEIGFDGFRYDFVKGYGAWMITAVQEYRYNRNGKEIRPFGVAED